MPRNDVDEEGRGRVAGVGSRAGKRRRRRTRLVLDAVHLAILVKRALQLPLAGIVLVVAHIHCGGDVEPEKGKAGGDVERRELCEHRGGPQL